MRDPPAPALCSGNYAFPQTRWSLVKRSAFRAEGDNAGMEEFCRIYWYPLYAAARRMGQSPEDACDAVQVLFCGLLTKDSLQKADPARGRLKSWLLAVLENQIRGGIRAGKAQKRGGGRTLFILDSVSAEAAYQIDPALHDDPAVTYRRQLATALLDESIETLAAFYAAAGKQDVFEALLPALEGPLEDTTYDAEAARLGCTSGALRMAVVRLRERFRKTLRQKAAVALGVMDGPVLNQELRDLFAGAP